MVVQVPHHVLIYLILHVIAVSVSVRLDGSSLVGSVLKVRNNLSESLAVLEVVIGRAVTLAFKHPLVIWYPGRLLYIFGTNLAIVNHNIAKKILIIVFIIIFQSAM